MTARLVKKRAFSVQASCFCVSHQSSRLPALGKKQAEGSPVRSVFSPYRYEGTVLYEVKSKIGRYDMLKGRLSFINSIKRSPVIRIF